MAGSALVLAGCGSDDDGGGGGGSNLPGLTTVRWTLNGGAGNIGATTDGGKAAAMTLTAGDDLLLDDGRTRPTVSTNFLTATETADGVVTYAELASIATPAIAGTTATFSLAGTGFELASGVTLNLSDAVSGTIDSVVIDADSPVIITGSVVTTRTGANSVNLALTTSSTVATSVVLTGFFDSRGDTGMDGGDFIISTTGAGSGMVFLSSVNTSGGIGDATQDGGDAGSFAVTSDDDMIFRHGSVQARGGAGTADGGDAAGMVISVTGEMQTDIRWSADSRGGDAGSGTGGNGSGFLIGWGTAGTTAVKVYAFVQGTGGDSSTGVGGTGGVALIQTTSASIEVTGTLHFSCSGGDVTNASGANGGEGGGSIRIQAETITDFLLIGSTNGGSSLGGNGGDAGACNFIANVSTNSRLQVTANGGQGLENGGDGGRANWGPSSSSGTMTFTDCRITATLNGGNGATGNGAFDGGDGGSVILGDDSSPTTLTMNTTNFTVSITANGGTTDSSTTGVGGAGGRLFVGHNMGTMEVSASGNLNGGASLNAAGSGAAGVGGQFQFQMEDGTLNATLTNANANGGAASGAGDGGTGGNLTIRPVRTPSTASGGATASVRVNLRGGSSVDGTGGGNGLVDINAGVAGFMSTNFVVAANGGDSQTGDGGTQVSNAVDGDFGGNTSITGINWNFSGGNGSTVSGNGAGGNCDDIDFTTTDFAITVSGTIVLNSGNGAGTGNGGSQNQELIVNLNSDSDTAAGSFTANLNFTANGGNAAGSGDGGTAGSAMDIDDGTATSGGNVTVNGTFTTNGGNSGSGMGGSGNTSIGNTLEINVNGNVTLNANFTANGGTGNTAGTGGTVSVVTDAKIDVNGDIITNGGNGTATGGAGGTVNMGGNTASSITIAASGVIRANGGSGTAIGAAGTINLDATGTGGNVQQPAGSLLQTNDGAGNAVSANITIQ